MTAKQWDYTKEQELIRKYLDDTLSKEEERWVAERYESDPEFRDALDGFELLTAAEFDQSMEAVTGRINAKITSSAGGGADAEETDNVRRMYPPKSNLRRIAIAATVVLCVAIGGTMLFNVVQSPNAKMFATHFEPKPYPDLITRGEGEDLSQDEKTAISEYNMENYEVSVQYFRDLYARYPENDKYGLFLGISYLGVKHFKEAVSTLEGLRGRTEKYAEDVDWYLALAYLRTKDVDSAQSLLEGLSGRTDSYYSEPALEILQKLN